MMKSTFLIVGACLGLLLAACQTTETPAGGFQSNPFTNAGESQKTPPAKRVADLLQEAKQQYDDRQFTMSFRYAEQAERLIKENKFPVEDEATAVAIQGYCLLQMGMLDDYAVDTFGVQAGAMRKFNRVLEISPNSFRAKLGMALLLFRRHGESIRKSESLDQGVIWLEQIREDAKRALNGGKDAPVRLREASRKYAILVSNRDKLVKLGYIFRDPSTQPMDDKGKRPEAPWLGSMTPEDEELAVKDIAWAFEDAEAGTKVTAKDRSQALAAIGNLADSWRKVRGYWRLAALKDLQSARDRFLQIRKESPNYFWVDRDLTFVYQCLGGFFLDVGLEQARLQSIAAGNMDDSLEKEARRIYTSKEFTSWEKEQSRKNYLDAKEFTVSFIRAHRKFEELRIARKEEANYDDLNANPFLVDLVQRYRQTMDQLIAEERGMRAQMILEAAALCIDPIFQINDTELALNFADQLKSLAPNNPIHYFVRATAHYTAKDFAAAKESYNAFLKDSSIVNGAQRDISRQRILECDEELKRSGGAGGKG